MVKLNTIPALLLPLGLTVILPACSSSSTAPLTPSAAGTVKRQAAVPLSGTLGPIVQPRMPGEILGFDIDQHGNDGLLANYRDLQGGITEATVERFDQRSGKITKMVVKTKSPSASYAIFGIVGRDVGFIDEGAGTYELMNPVTGGKITGTWTPPIPFIVSQIAENQSSATSVMLGYDKRYGSFPTAIVVADVLKTTGSVIALDQNVFGTGNVPTIAQDVATNQAVVTGGNSAPYTHPSIGIVDLSKGKVSTFTALGDGSINSVAVDPKTGTACTVTNLDEGLEFYKIKSQSGFEVFIPNNGSQLQSGSQVAMDPIHGLCIVTQPVSTGQGTQQSAVWVYDEKGNLQEGISGFNFWFGAGLAIDPAKRRGYVLNPRPGYLTLTGFTY
jgi:hypothetical protein